MITRDNICWPTVEAACNERITALHLDLEACPPDRIPRLQGEIAALRWLILQSELPEILKSTSMDI